MLQMMIYAFYSTYSTLKTVNKAMGALQGVYKAGTHSH